MLIIETSGIQFAYSIHVIHGLVSITKLNILCISEYWTRFQILCNNAGCWEEAHFYRNGKKLGKGKQKEQSFKHATYLGKFELYPDVKPTKSIFATLWLQFKFFNPGLSTVLTVLHLFMVKISWKMIKI